MYSVQYTVQCAMYSVQYTVQCTLYSVKYTLQCTMYSGKIASDNLRYVEQERKIHVYRILDLVSDKKMAR